MGGCSWQYQRAMRENRRAFIRWSGAHLHRRSCIVSEWIRGGDRIRPATQGQGARRRASTRRTLARQQARTQGAQHDARRRTAGARTATAAQTRETDAGRGADACWCSGLGKIRAGPGCRATIAQPEHQRGQAVERRRGAAEEREWRLARCVLHCPDKGCRRAAGPAPPSGGRDLSFAVGAAIERTGADGESEEFRPHRPAQSTDRA